MSSKIIHPGLLTTIQDGGRYGYQKEGIIVSGAMDRLALRMGNLLVGNQEKMAGLEITQTGPTIEFQEKCLIAITGANLSPSINQQPVPMWRPVFVEKHSSLIFGKPIQGCRSYLTFAGGLSVPEVLGSASTYLRAKIGGWHGRALQKGDCIPYNQLPANYLLANQALKPAHGFSYARWFLNPAALIPYSANPVIRVIPGPEYEWFTEESIKQFWQSTYTISHQADRMGYRLTGNLLLVKYNRELLSSAVTFGTIQVPSDGNPILLMADHQTTGGYPRIGQVASVDLPVLAQCLPGTSVFFKEICHKEAHQLYIAQEKKLNAAKHALKMKLATIMLL